ncbi:MAG TPA: globin family protein [Verrucomicrobiae bacterium]|nr:globin family protein [Verrucomicrobiae bacterium]
MTPRQKDLVKSSFAAVEPIADVAASIFYDRLFALDPEVRRLFAATDMAAQRKNLMQTLTVVVRGIDRLENLVPAVEALGRRHTTYGVNPEHFETVGVALIDTLRIGLGELFDTETQEAWTAAYTILATVMIGAGKAAEAAAAEAAA